MVPLAPFPSHQGNLIQSRSCSCTWSVGSTDNRTGLGPHRSWIFIECMNITGLESSNLLLNTILCFLFSNGKAENYNQGLKNGLFREPVMWICPKWVNLIYQLDMWDFIVGWTNRIKLGTGSIGQLLVTVSLFGWALHPLELQVFKWKGGPTSLKREQYIIVLHLPPSQSQSTLPYSGSLFHSLSNVNKLSSFLMGQKL